MSHRQKPGSGQGVGVVLDSQPVGGGQHQGLDGRNQAFPVFGGVVHPVKAGLRGIHLEPLLCSSGAQAQASLPVVHYQSFRLLLAVGCHPYRHLPDGRFGRVFAQQAVVNKPLLGKGKLGLPVGAFGNYVQHRIPHLAGPGPHDGSNRLMGGFFQGRPQILGLCVLILVAGEITVQALPEYLGSQKLFQHPYNRCAFAVADGVKKLADLGRVFDFLLNGMGIFQAVQAQRPVGVHVHELGPHLPFREEPVHRLGAHPGGKTFVQPEIVPPPHGHQVTKPHVGHFVSHHLGHALAGSRRGILRVHQQSGLPIGDRPPVFHGPGGKVWDGDVVQLLQRVGDTEVVVEEGEQFHRCVQGKPPLFLFAPGGPDANSCSAGCLLFDVGQVTDHKGQEVS